MYIIPKISFPLNIIFLQDSKAFDIGTDKI